MSFYGRHTGGEAGPAAALRRAVSGLTVLIMAGAAAVPAVASPARDVPSHTGTVPSGAAAAVAGSGATAAPAADGPSSASLPSAQFAGTARRVAGVLLTGQPTPRGLTLARSAGIGTVIDLRTLAEHEGEGGTFDEATAVRALGMAYEHLPLGRDASDWTPAALARFDRLMRSAGNGTILLHCASGRRASYLTTAWLMRYRGLTLERALEYTRADLPPDSAVLAGLLGRQDDHSR